MAKTKKEEVYNLSEILMDDKLYEVTKEKNKKKILNNLLSKDDDIVAYIETSDEEEFEMDITRGNLLSYLILFYPFKKYQILPPSYLIEELKSVDDMNEYLDGTIRYFADFHDILIGEEIKDIISELSKLSSIILGRYGASINLFDVCQLMRKNPKFKELIDFKINDLKENLGFKDIMNILKEKTDELIEILKEEDTSYNILLNSGAGVNILQLRECLLNIGFKPDMNDRIIPEPLDTSYIRGLSVYQFLADAIGGRKALIINFRKTKDSGYFTRKTSFAVIDIDLAEDVEDCGTVHTISCYIDSKKTLNKLVYRNYVDENGNIQQISPYEDNDNLIGTTIQLRSPITCACQNKVCKTCYGSLYRYAKGKNIALTAMFILNNQNTQLSLSAKHHLQASISEVKWGKEFNEFFTVDKDKIMIKEHYRKNIKILITELIEEENSYDDFNKINSFVVIDNKNNRFKISTPKTLIINEQVIDDLEAHYDMDSEGYVINSKELDEDDILFTYVMDNNALMSSLNNITNLLDTNAYLDGHNINDVFARMVQVLNESPLVVHFIHLEILLREMCEIEENDRGLFKFNYEESPIKKIVRITDLLVKNKALGKSLMFQEQYSQLTRMIESYEKNIPSKFDIFM